MEIDKTNPKLRRLIHFYPCGITMLLGYMILFMMENTLSNVLRHIIMTALIILGGSVYALLELEAEGYKNEINQLVQIWVFA